jgi:hypothetical protein
MRGYRPALGRNGRRRKLTGPGADPDRGPCLVRTSASNALEHFRGVVRPAPSVPGCTQYLHPAIAGRARDDHRPREAPADLRRPRACDRRWGFATPGSEGALDRGVRWLWCTHDPCTAGQFAAPVRGDSWIGNFEPVPHRSWVATRGSGRGSRRPTLNERSRLRRPPRSQIRLEPKEIGSPRTTTRPSSERSRPPDERAPDCPNGRASGRARDNDGRSRLRCLTGLLASLHWGGGPIDRRDRGR